MISRDFLREICFQRKDAATIAEIEDAASPCEKGEWEGDADADAEEDADCCSESWGWTAHVEEG
jgi:hypothetical protein